MLYHLKLIKARSYCGVVSATRKKPDVFVEDKAAADAAVASGYFQLICEEETPPESGEIEPSDGEPEQTGGEPETTGKTLDKMTVAELETFATYHNVSLKGIRGKENIIAKLREELGREETENEVSYGSPTMTDLQEQ